jgi:predicted P-loop ATPase
MSKDLKRLYDMGFAVHLLHPRSKKPIGTKWTKGARKSWSFIESELKANPKLNVGVRLGSPSKLKAGYLAVIDCDVKSTQGKHVAEMLRRLNEVTNDEIFPTVFSGRGNGSRHLYMVTSEPAAPKRLAQSKEKVLVRMPSVKPSKHELETIPPAQLEAGWRLRPAWEIAVMGENQQVVLPPSLHPDTGKRYEWDEKGLPRAFPNFAAEAYVKDEKELSEKFEAVEVDLISSPLPSRIVDQIMSGDQVEDRSAALLGVTNSMLRAGFTENEVLSVLTDRDNYLGEVAYEHTQSESRSRAAEWVRKYTLEKSKRETSLDKIFESEVVETILGDAEAATQEEAAVAPKTELPWRERIERNMEDLRPKNTLQNVILILQGEGGHLVFRRDEFANAELYGLDTPWGGKKGSEFSDLDTIRIKRWLSEHYRFEPSDDRINQAVSSIADTNRFHPVRDYLDRLVWDGKPRLDSWLKRYLNASAPEPYLSAVSRKVLCAMVARVYQPGIKFDQVLILEGLQGKGKSTALRNLASDAFFTDTPIDVKDKDAIMNMRSVWLVELGELSTMRATDVEDLKAFISRTTDRIRVPYGKRAENFPRQCIFIGTTNRDEYLKDPTGNRRFWPVTVGECDFDSVKRDRDQLLAEAKAAYDLGEPLYLEDPDMNSAAIKEQEARTVSDAWEDILVRWLDGEDTSELSVAVDRKKFTMEELFQPGGPLSEWKMNPLELKRAGDALRRLGFVKKPLRDPKTKRLRKYWIAREGRYPSVTPLAG